MSYAELALRIAGCTACPLAEGRSSVVVGSGPVPAPLALVGEAPGAEEDESGLPFVGRAGRLLDALLAEAGLCRGDAAVLNVVKCRPPGNRPPRRGEIDACRGWLDAQLAAVAPRLVVAMGGTAAGWFLGRGHRLADLRGRVHSVTGRRVLATYHPSAAIRFGPRGAPMAALRRDLALAASLL